MNFIINPQRDLKYCDCFSFNCNTSNFYMDACAFIDSLFVNDYCGPRIYFSAEHNVHIVSLS